jgi:hypothetical protein
MPRMRVVRKGSGPDWVDTTTDEEASYIGRYWNAVKAVVTGEDTGHYIEDFEDGDLEIDEFVLLDYAEAGEIDFDDIYEAVST